MGIRKKLEDIFAAAAFAEKGEIETARRLAGKRTVLLVLRGNEKDRASFLFALNVSKRVDAAIEAVFVAPAPDMAGLLGDFRSEAGKEGISFGSTRVEGCIKKGVLDYTEGRPDVQMVIVESAKDLDQDCNEREVLRAWRYLDCPLVVVTDAKA